MSKFMIQGCTCMKDGGFEELQDKFGCKKNDNLLLTIHHMSERLDKLEQDNRDLRALLENRSTNKTIQLCDLPEPEISYDNWIELLLSSVKNELTTVFEGDLLTGINNVFKTAVDQFHCLPILVFDRKPHTFYYYVDSSWKVLDNLELENIIKRISYRFLVDFNTEWYQVNKQKIKASEEYNNLYIDYHKKILGGTRISDESRHQRVRHNLYTLIKTAKL
jgi:hypothetical protein